MKIFKNKNNKKVEEKTVELTIDATKNVTEETVDKIVENVTTVVADKLVEETKTETRAPRTRTTKKKEPKVPCRVLVATPSYYVINKNGEKITINKKNTYHRGEEVLY